MEELSNLHLVALLGFLIAMVFGFVGNKTHFCSMGAISDVVNMGSRGRMGAWFFAIGIAILGVQYLYLSGRVDIDASVYRSPNLYLLSYVLGGILFGIGMTLAAGCGQRNLVRVGGGNLKALIVLIVLGITAYMTMRGILAIVRLEYIYPISADLTNQGIDNQGLFSYIGALLNIEDISLLQKIGGFVVAFGFIAYAFKHEEFRKSFDNLLAGIVIGVCVVAAWYVSGHVGQDDFDPITPQGMAFIGPVGNTISYLMTYTGAEINFGIAIVFGMIFGSFIYAIISGTFRIETFSNKSEMVNHLVGAMMMGFGGVLSFGCTIGQGVTGISTLAIGSFLTLASIIFGCALTMKIQYHMLDEKGFMGALGTGLAELLIPWKKQEA
ncbi:MAG: YeeE/YedE family protein [Gammaproteobacteria bacterium]|nr:MAG: YeeE/YedE family protein [Gammaproteobacteria bacterium]